MKKILFALMSACTLFAACTTVHTSATQLTPNQPTAADTSTNEQPTAGRHY